MFPELSAPPSGRPTQAGLLLVAYSLASIRFNTIIHSVFKVVYYVCNSCCFLHSFQLHVCMLLFFFYSVYEQIVTFFSDLDFNNRSGVICPVVVAASRFVIDRHQII